MSALDSRAGKSLLPSCAWLLLIMLCSCVNDYQKAAVTNLEDQYGTGFRTMVTPDADGIQRRGKGRDVTADSDQKLLLAAIKVAFQRGPIVRADRTSGVIIAPPFALLVMSRTQRFRIYCVFMDELYFDRADPKHELVAIKPEEKDDYVNEMLDQIATQAAISEDLKPGGKWHYLSP